MDSDTAYKALLMANQGEDIKNLDPCHSPKDNLDWLWNSVKQLGEMDPEIQCALCQLALIFGRSTLQQPQVMHFLKLPDLDTNTRIHYIISSLTKQTSHEPARLEEYGQLSLQLTKRPPGPTDSLH